MKYVLNLDKDGRILSASFVNERTPGDAVTVDELPEGNIADYLYNGGFVHDPLPKPEQPEAEDTLEVRVGDLEEALNMILSGVTE